MPLVTMKDILKGSISKKYAVGAFDTLDYVYTEAVLNAAEAKNVPVILMVVEPMFDFPNADRLMQYMIDRCKQSSVPVALHLDHGHSFEGVMKAIHYGCTSVMLDGSSLPFEENVALTKKIVEVAHACNVTVEAEIGHVAGHEGNMLDGNVADESAYTTVEEAVKFVELTDVDCLAVAIGTVHGVYKGTPKLDLQRLQAIRDAVDIPLVMHGGSGLPVSDFKNAIAHGINKINFFTGMAIGGAEAVRDYVRKKDAEGKRFMLGDIVEVGAKRVTEIVSEHIDIFGTRPLSL